MKVSVLVIVLIVILFASIFYLELNSRKLEGFDTNVCSSLNATKCTNTAGCNWISSSKTCMSCVDLSGCGGCVDTGNCVWLLDDKKCVLADRMGFPTGPNKGSRFADTPDTCLAQPPTVINPDNSDQPDLSLPVLSYSDTACPNTDAIVETVKTKIGTDYIKNLVNAELKKNGIKTVEGFTGYEDAIALAVVGSISDDIRDLITKAIKK